MLEHAPISFGRRSEIYALDDNRVLKLYDKNFSKKRILDEFQKAQIVYALNDIHTPKPIDVREERGRTGIVFERVHGTALMNLFQKLPWLYFTYARKIAAIHNTIHHIQITDLPSQREEFTKTISESGRLTQQDKERLLRILNEPHESVLCHGDFHHGNLIRTKDGTFSIIDWMDAFSGDYRLDIALTAVNAVVSDAPAHVPAFYRKIYDLLKKILNLDQRYIRFYGLEHEDMTRFLFLAAGIHLARCNKADDSAHRAYFESAKQLFTHKVIIVPGLGDETRKLEWVTRSWRKHGWHPIIHSMAWRNNKESFREKHARLLALIDQLSGQGSVIALVGTSAGGSAVMNAFMERRNVVSRVVNVCGRLRVGTHTGIHSFEARTASSRAFAESVKQSEEGQATLTLWDKKKILTIKPLLGDEVVPANTTTIPGTKNISIPSSEHVLSIAFTFILFSRIIFTFLKHRLYVVGGPSRAGKTSIETLLTGKELIGNGYIKSEYPEFEARLKYPILQALFTKGEIPDRTSSLKFDVHIIADPLIPLPRTTYQDSCTISEAKSVPPAQTLIVFPMDSIRSFIRVILLGETWNRHNGLGGVVLEATTSFVFKDGASPDELKIKIPESEPDRNNEDVITWRAMAGLIRLYDQDSQNDLLVEGVSVTPKNIRELKVENLVPHVAFVGCTDEQAYHQRFPQSDLPTERMFELIDTSKRLESELKKREYQRRLFRYYDVGVCSLRNIASGL